MESEPTSTTDFAAWLQAVELEELEPYALHEAVENLTTEGHFSCTPSADEETTAHMVSTPAVTQKLALVTEKARQHFLRELRRVYMNGMQPDVWLSIQKEKA